MLTMRFFGITLVWACRRKSSALITFMCLQLLMVITSAASFHHKDLTFPFRILQWLFPLHRAFNSLLNWEFGGAAGIGVSTSNANVRFTCSHNPIIQQENAILIKADCGLESRDHILKWFNITTHSLSHDLLFFALASTFFLIASVVSFGCCARTKHRSWSRKLKTFH